MEFQPTEIEGKVPLSALFVEAVSNANEHAYSLRDLQRRHRKFLINNDLKSILRVVYLDVFNLIKQLAGKVLLHPAIKKFSEDLLQKWLKTYQSVTNTISTTTSMTPQSGGKAHQMDGFPKNKDAASASDFRPVIKLSDKDVINHFRGMEPQTIMKEINNAIQVDKEILKEYLPIIVQELKQLCSREFEFFTEKVEHVQTLQGATYGVIVFEANARV